MTAMHNGCSMMPNMLIAIITIVTIISTIIIAIIAIITHDHNH